MNQVMARLQNAQSSNHFVFSGNTQPVSRSPSPVRGIESDSMDLNLPYDDVTSPSETSLTSASSTSPPLQPLPQPRTTKSSLLLKQLHAQKSARRNAHTTARTEAIKQSVSKWYKLIETTGEAPLASPQRQLKRPVCLIDEI